jgi:heme exporter protein D
MFACDVPTALGATMLLASSSFDRWGVFVYTLFASFVWLFVLIVFAVVAGALVIAIIRSRRRERAAEAEREKARLAKLRPDGLPLPPHGRGMCAACGKAFERVYFLSDGRRLCPGCYESLEMNASAPAMGTRAEG